MTPVRLPAILDLPAARSLAETMRDVTGPIVLDGAAIERIGIAGLQLLLSAHRTARAAGHAFAIERPSAALEAAARTAGATILLATAR